MIRLGLERISRLLIGTKLPWRAIHVAGTNGKGSICAALSYALQHARVGSIGRFTSPHLIDRWDCITIDGAPISSAIFHQVEAAVKARNDAESIGASEFELLTATAFEIFTRERVQVAIIECGMGGLTDATNVLRPAQLLATVIAHISLDHQSFLGDTVAAIAQHKAGIIKPGDPAAPCIVDASNDPEVLAVVDRVATENGVRVFKAAPAPGQPSPDDAALETSQRRNLACAAAVLSAVLPELAPVETVTPDALGAALRAGLATLPGRYQSLSVTPLVQQRRRPVLLDGAHNLTAWQSLARYVGAHVRRDGGPVVWVLALSGGRTLAPMLETLVQRGDGIVITEFGAVAGMPWVQAMPVEELRSEVLALGIASRVRVAKDIKGALQVACEGAGGEEGVVIAGSLYLVSDTLRALRDAATTGGE